MSATEWQQQLADLLKQKATAANLMTAPVITIQSTAPLHQAIQTMTTKHLKRLPVVTENGRLVGWVSRVDILRTLEHHHHPITKAMPETTHTGATIADLMYQDTPTVTPQASLEEVLQVLEKNRRRRAVVVDNTGRVVGIISDGDLLQRTQKETHPDLLTRLRGLVTGPSTNRVTLPQATEKAVDLMTTPVITVSVNTTPAEALRLMLQHGIKRLPVVDENGCLLGLLGRDSLLHSFIA